MNAFNYFLFYGLAGAFLNYLFCHSPKVSLLDYLRSEFKATLISSTGILTSALVLYNGDADPFSPMAIVPMVLAGFGIDNKFNKAPE